MFSLENAYEFYWQTSAKFLKTMITTMKGYQNQQKEMLNGRFDLS
jgi:hypothetical protein